MIKSQLQKLSITPTARDGQPYYGIAPRSSYAPQRHNRMYESVRKYRIRSNGSSSDEGKELGDLFKEELARRNIDSIDDIGEGTDSGFTPGRPPAPIKRSVAAPPRFSRDTDDYETPPQLLKSRQLNSEGLEGLPGRAAVLLRLGASFFLGFGPLILFVVVAFSGIYFVFGDAFVHSGTPSVSPPIIYNPDELLSAPTVDPMIPM